MKIKCHFGIKETKVIMVNNWQQICNCMLLSSFDRYTYTCKRYRYTCNRRLGLCDSIMADRTGKFIFLRWETFYLVTSNKHNRIMTLRPHLTADSLLNQEFCQMKECLKKTSTAFTNVVQNKTLASEKQNYVLLLFLWLHTSWPTQWSCDPPVEKHC